MNKKILPAWEPARLVQGRTRWYISFYAFDDRDGKRKKFRPTFNLNRIHDETKRMQRGKDLAEKVNWWLTKGKPISEFDEINVRNNPFGESYVEINELTRINTIKAIQFAIDLKCNGSRKDTARSYKSIRGLFIKFLKDSGWDKIAIFELQKKYAIAYIDHCKIDRKLGNWSYNNNIRHLRAICNELKNRGYISVNPFSRISFSEIPCLHHLIIFLPKSIVIGWAE
ncbi:MAG: hypothetical protein GY705_03205 [Bacteroidetes bacterium]|nr:hypothetical protein [Bacteroidota bacterium]